MNARTKVEESGAFEADYGFGGQAADAAGADAKPSLNEVRAAAAATEGLGFRDREPRTRKLRPGPKQREAQGKVTIPGPSRVIDWFRGYCIENDLTLWEGLERLQKVEARKAKR